MSQWRFGVASLNCTTYKKHVAVYVMSIFFALLHKLSETLFALTSVTRCSLSPRRCEEDVGTRATRDRREKEKKAVSKRRRVRHALDVGWMVARWFGKKFSFRTRKKKCCSVFVENNVCALLNSYGKQFEYRA